MGATVNGTKWVIGSVLVEICLLSPSQASDSGQQKASSGPAAISVGPNREVSRADDASSHEEVLIAAHPTDPEQLLACSMVDTNKMAQRKMHTIVYTSDDAGTT